jgi:hypothetical protein
VRFKDFTAVLMKIPVFWDMELCRLIQKYRSFGGACCFLGLEIT